MYNFYCNLRNCVCIIMIMIIIYLHSCALFIRLEKFHIFLSTYLFIHKNGVLPKSFLWRLNVYTKPLAIHTHMSAWSIWPDYHYITWLAHGTSESKKKPAEKKIWKWNCCHTVDTCSIISCFMHLCITRCRWI